MQNPKPRLTQSPCLLRSRSGTPPPPESPAPTPHSGASTIRRSKSTARSRTTTGAEQQNAYPWLQFSTAQKDRSQESRSSSFRKPNTQIGGINGMNRVAKKAQSVPNSPSAWALSPGRSPPTPIWSPSPPPAAVVGQSKTKTKSGSGGGVSGVLKYFVRQKKVTRAQEEQIRRYRVVNNGLLQWRFANARAEAAMAAAKILAENKLYNGRIKIMKMRNSNMGKRIELQKLKHEIKVDGIIREEIYLLKEWAKLETRNSAAVGKLGITLSAVSNRLPFVHGAKVELGSIYAALRIAIQLMGDIKETISKFIYKAEEMRYLLAQVSRTMKREKECLEQMGRIVSIIAVPEALREQSLRIHLMQATKNFED